MEQLRKPFQGVWNIVRFNWHFYVVATMFLIALASLSVYINGIAQLLLVVTGICLISTIFISLIVSYWIYDWSDLYTFNWLPLSNSPTHVVNINAGFDETSSLLKRKFSNSHLQVFDFYDPKKHTEISIKRARQAYPSYPNTVTINTNKIPVHDEAVDIIFNILSAHEIRDMEERIKFFREMARTVKPDGLIIVTEHLRDCANFLAFNIGYLHFHSKATWIETFKRAGLTIRHEQKTTPFITTFNLIKNGNAS